MKRRSVHIAPEADAQARRAEVWWRENRTASPDLFEREFRHAWDFVASFPEVGQPYGDDAKRGVRRVGMPRSRFHLYYVVRDEAVVILAVWSAVRGTGPPLPRSDEP